jgi:hypothetical protein
MLKLKVKKEEFVQLLIRGPKNPFRLFVMVKLLNGSTANDL